MNPIWIMHEGCHHLAVTVNLGDDPYVEFLVSESSNSYADRVKLRCLRLTKDAVKQLKGLMNSTTINYSDERRAIGKKKGAGHGAGAIP